MNLTYNHGEVPEAIREELGAYLTDMLDDAFQAGVHASHAGPYDLDISTAENAIVLTLKSATGETAVELPVRIWRQHILDRMGFVEGTYDMIRNGTPNQIEAQDMARRKHHNDSANLIAGTLAKHHVEIDFDAARTLFAVVAEIVAPSFRQKSRDEGQAIG